MAKKKKPNGHFCWVCGEHKAHEKFSGRGHATHMCKQCHALPVAERNQMVAVRKAENMAFRHLNEQEIKWLRKKMNDPRPEVREAACEAHHIKFPGYERSQYKKGLTAFSLEFFIHGEIWNEWGDEINVHMLFTMEHTGIIRRINHDTPEKERETEITIDAREAKKFLKSIIHELDALFWDEDMSDAGVEESAENREPLWSLCLELNNGEDKKITFYNQMHDAPQELFWLLAEWFEPDEDFDEE